MVCKPLFKQFVCNHSCMMNPFLLYSWVDIYWWSLVGWYLLVVSYTHIGPLECWGRIFYGNYHEFVVWRQQYAFVEQLICNHIGCVSSNVDGVINYISSHCEACLVWVFLLWVIIHHNSSIGQFLILCHALMFDEVYCVRDFDVSANSFG